MPRTQSRQKNSVNLRNLRLKNSFFSVFSVPSVAQKGEARSLSRTGLKILSEAKPVRRSLVRRRIPRLQGKCGGDACPELAEGTESTSAVASCEGGFAPKFPSLLFSEKFRISARRCLFAARRRNVLRRVRADKLTNDAIIRKNR